MRSSILIFEHRYIHSPLAVEVGMIGDVSESGYVYNFTQNMTENSISLTALEDSKQFLNLNTRALVLEFLVVNREINIITSVSI